MIKGISEHQLKTIKNILNPYANNYEFFIYGSRVKGNFQPNSDLDLLIKGSKKISLDTIDEMKELFDNSSLPFIVHITDFHNIDKSFYDIIKKDMIKI